jgi:hypothetical protein
MSTNETNQEVNTEVEVTNSNETTATDSEVVIDDTPVEESFTVNVNDELLVTEAVEEPKTVKEQPVEEEEVIERKRQTVTQDTDINHKDKLEYIETLALPSNYDDETRKALEKAPNVSMVDNEQGREWASVVAEGMDYSTTSDVFVPTLEDEKANFKQHLEHNNIRLAGDIPKFNAIENQQLKGERSVIRMLSHLGLGTLFQTPLWHTGIWVTFKPPSESEIIEINRIIQSDKIRLGRYTYGLAFSNITSYTIDRLVEFALNHVYSTTIKNEEAPISSLRQIISSQDIPSLLWGFVCSMYPRGFNYVRSCVNDPDKCTHIVKDTINVSKLQWINDNTLTDWQKTHMSKRQPNTKDLASIERYKEELSITQKRKITVNEGTDKAMAIIIKSPSIAEYVDAGHRWVGDIVETVNKAIGADARDRERNEIITKHGQASAMRQYSHWVSSIEIGTNTIEDLESIEKNLDVLSSDDAIRGQFITEVIDYINKSTMAVIGIPVYDCPHCNKTQSGSVTLPKFTNVIPLDVVQVFFGLLTQRLERMAAR